VSRRRGLTVAVAAAVALATLPGMPGAAAQDLEDEVASAADALAHATEREREAVARYEEAVAALPEAEARLEAARAAVEEAEQRAESAARDEQQALAALERADREHARLRREVERAQEQIDQLIAAAYMGGDAYGFTAVVTARGPGDLLDRLSFLDQISARKRAALAQLQAARAQAEAAVTAASRARQRAEEARVAAQQALADAREARAEAEAAAAEVAALVDARAEALEVARAERRRAEAELARVEEQLRAWQEANGAGPALPSDFTLLMPVDGVLTSGYGMRVHPITGENLMHAGVDFGAPSGAPIRAAADGVVMQAGWNGGYGNFTCLSHGTYDGRQLSTCYAHQSEILVAPDDVVRAGTVIGRVGSTGDSTGPHLHFEVRLDGAHTDPLPWLPECLC
jgi:murein DD-endopeptidase MepM/ murein hydrolase activator NlpD